MDATYYYTCLHLSSAEYISCLLADDMNILYKKTVFENYNIGLGFFVYYIGFDFIIGLKVLYVLKCHTIRLSNTCILGSYVPKEYYVTLYKYGYFVLLTSDVAISTEIIVTYNSFHFLSLIIL